MLCEVEPVLPPLSVTVRAMAYVPAAAYVCDGFCTVDVLPSPKFQLQLAMVPSASVLVLVRVQASPVQLRVNAAVGAWLLTVTLSEAAPVAPALSVTVSFTVRVPLLP